MTWGRNRRSLIENTSLAQQVTVRCAHCPDYVLTTDFAAARDAQRAHVARMHPELVPKRKRRSHKK